MILKAISACLVGAALLAAASPSRAEDYRADEYLSLDPSQALLSPKPLGPPSEFAPVPVEAKADHAAEAAQAPAQLAVAPKVVVRKTTRPVHVAREKPARPARDKPVRLAREKPRAPATSHVARRHTNPLDAQAFDTRIQTWPCRSGGICNWKPAE
ncbi:hypothetical protein [Bradyrhizobium sp. NP1]|uniref:hypothetical protein n=1 Tax=Bradyrhizobium sp. NP1 TaxID=3049772 RepID=UPI0025A54056|nr:hypothetical protein [Bradyrhizobium sp. NP1]WJR80240.1 hypothetical protein QOU61_10925 [Bradyrhizobium sp. NP1]